MDLKVSIRPIDLKYLNSLPDIISSFELRLNMIKNLLCIDSIRKFVISSANTFLG